jgi:brefeldin A-inhibited guanine nucleotide-exchange protein
MNIISKFGSASSSNHQKINEPSSPAPSPTVKNQTNTTSTWSVSPISVPGTMDTSIIGLSEGQLRRQGLECLVAVLRSLVTWGTAGKGPDETASVISGRSQTEEIKRDAATPEPHFDKLATTSSSVETFRQATPDIVDDPTKFESAKQKKTTLLEGIKKFNYKPKRVSQPCNR